MTNDVTRQYKVVVPLSSLSHGDAVYPVVDELVELPIDQAWYNDLVVNGVLLATAQPDKVQLLDIGDDNLTRILMDAGYVSREQLLNATDDELLKIKGIGMSKVKTIRDWLEAE